MGIVWDRGYFHANDLQQCIADVCTYEKRAVLNVVVHGTVRGEKLLLADKSLASEDLREDLRKVGIYAIGQMAESAGA